MERIKRSAFISETTGRGTAAARMSGTGTVLQQFVSGLKSRNEDTRAKAAKDLQHYVTTELREVCNTFCSHIIFTKNALTCFLFLSEMIIRLLHHYINTRSISRFTNIHRPNFILEKMKNIIIKAVNDYL